MKYILRYKNNKSFLRKARQKSFIELFILTLPALSLLFLFNYLPMAGIVIAFKNFRPLEGIWKSSWIGLKNFEFFFKSSQVWNVTRNTLLYNICFIILTAAISISFAIMLYEIGKSRFVKLYQTIFFFPFFMSWVVVSIMLYAFLKGEHGLINQILTILGMSPVNWYARADLWPYILIFMYLWKNIGYNTIIYYAGLMGIDPGLYESASIDGANRRTRTFSITIPLLAPIIVVLMILSIGRIFYADFGLFYQLPLRSGVLLPTTDVINYFTYRALIELNDYGMSSAIGLYQSVMGFILVLLTNLTARKISGNENSLF